MDTSSGNYRYLWGKPTPRTKTRSRARPPELRPSFERARAEGRRPGGGAAGGEARARARRAAHALAATGTVLARPDPSTDGCARTWLRQRVRGLHEVPERCRAWAETEARRFESQFVHEEHDEDLHGKGAGLCPRPCLTGQRHLHLLLPRRLELKVCAPPALARSIPHPSPLTCRLTR